MSFEDTTQCANLPLEECNSFDIFAGVNPSDDDALGDGYHWCKDTDDFDEQHSCPREQRASDIATRLLTRLTGEPHFLKLDSPPSIYNKENQVGDGSLHHDPRYRIDPVFGPQPV